MKPYKKALLKPWWDKYPDYLPLGAKWRGLWQKGTVSRIIKEIDQRSLDIEIAEKVFGHKVEIIELTEYHDYGGQTEHPALGFKIKQDEDPLYLKDIRETEPNFPDHYFEDIELPHYSTKIEDAWQIVEKMPVFTIEFQQYSRASALYYARTDNYQTGEFSADTAPLAICKAALMLVEKNANK